MNSIKSLVLGAAVLLCSTSLYSEENKEKLAKEGLAVEYLILSKTRETFDMTIEAYVQQFSSQNSTADKEGMRAFFNTYMGWSALQQPTIEIVAKSLTVKELQDINKFLKSSSGRSYAEKTPQMAADISNLIAANMQKAMQDMQNPK